MLGRRARLLVRPRVLVATAVSRRAAKGRGSLTPKEQRISRVTLFAVAALAALGAFVAIPAAPALADTCTVLNAYQSSTSFSYRRCQIPDVDQVRAADGGNNILGLPNNGLMYCAPAAAMDMMAYIANHGFPSVSPGPGYWGPETWSSHVQYNIMTSALAQIGALMGTDPYTGTGASGAANGMAEWLGGANGMFLVSHFGTTGYDNGPTLSQLALSAENGALVIPVIGWYSYDGMQWTRKGGHVLALSAAFASGATQQMGVNDPAFTNDDAYDQSSFHTDLHTLAPVVGLFNGWVRTMQQVSGYKNAFLDEYFVIYPFSGLTAEKNWISTIKPIQLQSEDGSVAPKVSTFPAADGKDVTDLAVDPLGTMHPYLVAGDDTVWELDQLTGRSAALATVPGARRLLVGGAGRTLYVLTGDAIVSLDGTGRIQHRVPLSVPLADITYDTAHNHVIGISADTQSLYTYDASLSPLGSAALPARVCEGGDISIQYDASNDVVWLHCDSSPQVVRVSLAGRVPAVTTVALQGARAPLGLTVADGGTLIVSDGGVLAAYDGAGRPVASPLSGMTGGSIVDVRRAFNNVDPALDRDPANQNQ